MMFQAPIFANATRLVSAAVFSILAASTAANAQGPAAKLRNVFTCPDLAERSLAQGLTHPLVQGYGGAFYRVSADLRDFYLYSRSNIQYFARLNEVLKSRDIDLTLVFVPPKSFMDAAFVPEEVWKEYDFDREMATQTYKLLNEDLTRAGLRSVDFLKLRDHFVEEGEERFFFLRDFHWMPRGSRATAKVVADALKQTEAYQDLNTKEFETEIVDAELLHLAGMHKIVDTLCTGPAVQEYMVRYETTEALNDLDSLLDDDATPVALIGTSFSDEINPYNFSGFLREFMQVEIASYAISGGGMESSVLDWTHNALPESEGTRFLIWELPMTAGIARFPEVTFRQIIPAVAGFCEADRQIAEVAYDIEPGGAVTMDLEELVPDQDHLIGSDYYLAMSLSESDVRSFALEISQRDGSSENVLINRPERVTSFSSLFFEMSQTQISPLRSITVKPGGEKALSGTLSLCRYGSSNS
jgi:hypothetical protein